MREQTAGQDNPAPLTDLRRRVNLKRRLILELLTERLGPVELGYDFEAVGGAVRSRSTHPS